MYLDLEQLREEYKLPPKEVIDSCLGVLMTSENKDDTLTISEQIAYGTLIHYKGLIIEDTDKEKE